MNSKKTQGFLLLLIFVWLGTFLLNDGFASEFNSKNLIRYCSMFGIIGIGAMFVIVTGGIDLSIGSTIGLVGASMVLLLRLNPVETLKPMGANEQSKVVCFFWILVGLMILSSVTWMVLAAIEKNFRARKLLFPGLFLATSVVSLIAFGYANSDSPNTTRIPCIFFLLFSISIHVGLLHGVLITKFQLQPFVVTLGGLLCYRGLVRWLTDDSTQGLGSTFDGSLRLLAEGEVCTVSSLMGFFGIVATAYYLISLLRTSKREVIPRRNAMVGILIGLVLSVIGSSRFWNGFSRTNFEELFNVTVLGVPLKFSTWETVISETAAARPQWLMSFAWVLLIPALLFLLVQLLLACLRRQREWDMQSVASEAPGDRMGFEPAWLPLDFFWMSERRQRNELNFLIVSIVGLVVSVFLLRYAYWIASDGQEQLWDGFSSRLQSWSESLVPLSESIRWWIETVSVFGSLGLVMVSIARLGTYVHRYGNEYSKICFPIACLLAILTVLSATELPTTLVQTPFFAMAFLAMFAILIFEKTVFGRYLLAIGNNEDAAKYSGIDTQEITVAAYVICSGIIGIAAMIFMLAFNTVAPTGFGSFYELYAIAAVVLGGCSLRGGEANVVGVLLGAAIMRILANAPDMIGFPKTLEYAILGLVIVVGVIVDERMRRNSERKALEQNAADAIALKEELRN